MKKPRKSSHATMTAAGKAALNCWPTVAEKELIAKAAGIDGRSMSDFVIRSAVAAAKKLVSKTTPPLSP